MRTRHTVGRVAAVALVVMTAAACRQDMHDQPSYTALEASTFFGDAQASRPLIEGTVPRGHLNEDALLNTGRVEGVQASLFPFPVDEALMARGRERFNIYCSPCHGQTGMGHGMVVQRGYRKPPAFSESRLREAPAGYFFDVISNGFGAMPDYAAQVKPADRWAIVAYIRALQLSAHATVEDVPAADRPKLDEVRTPGATPQAEAH